jgi:predicted phosphodiesterase/CheY-like chemotaxis protein
MRKKRILICDDNNLQFDQLKKILEESYEIYRSVDYRNALDDLMRHDPIHMLILDLGFGDKRYIGHGCIPAVIEKYPTIKIIVYSDILKAKGKSQEAEAISRELAQYSQVVAFLSPGIDTAPKVLFEVGRAIGTPQWLRQKELWMLHVSDVQFGGEGMGWEAEPLARKIWETVQTFIQNDPSVDDTKSRDYPGIAIMTGDLTEHARPSEFEEASIFGEKFSELITERSRDLAGVLGRHNIIAIPGNHDINWDISFARNLHKKEKIDPNDPPVEYKHGKDNLREDLEYLWRYSWIPFCEMKCGLPEAETDWAWEKGYKIYNLKEELRLIFVCLNSSRWGVNHLEYEALVPTSIWYEIETKLNVLDPDKEAARILLVHHTLAREADPKDRLMLKEHPTEPKLLVSMLSKTCNFSIVLTGHFHELVADELNTGSEKRKLVYVGAGTTQSGDRKEYRNPQFNILRLGDMSDDYKFQTLTVYPFNWDGSTFCEYPAWEDGTRSWRSFELKY